MLHDSPYSSPGATPPQIEIVETATPWSDVLLDNLRTTVRAGTPLLSGSYNNFSSRSSRRRLKCWTRVVWLSLASIVVTWWLLRKGKQTIRLEMIPFHSHSDVDGLKFIDATHPYIRYIGRWTTSPDGSHKDGTFAGAYLDFVVNGSSTVLVSLYNGKEENVSPEQRPSHKSPSLNFLPIINVTSASPISLLARVCDDEYIVLPNAASVVPIRKGDLDVLTQYEIRIISPMVGQQNTFQFEGIWIEEGGNLLPIQSEDEGFPIDTPKSGSPKGHKMIEILTDIAGSKAMNMYSNVGTTRRILSGVMGWEYLLGEMFTADHVTIGMDDMCLVHDCIGGQGAPVGLADVFFQSGPFGSPQYAQPWHFQDYMPDVMVMNIGSSDWNSFQTYSQEYNKTLWELSVIFEDAYISMIKAIRALAYPKYSSSAVDSSRYSFATQGTGSNIPIFIMRPFRGQLEQATHAVVERLRKDGDKSIFWLDTSGWLNTDVDFGGRPEEQDFFLDGPDTSKKWRLTERGNQKAAMFLHFHVCRYLAQDSEKCAFLQPETYQGRALDHEAIRLSEFIDDEREKKLKKLFWE